MGWLVDRGVETTNQYKIVVDKIFPWRRVGMHIIMTFGKNLVAMRIT